MDFPEPDLTEQEEIDQILDDIERGCCKGEFSESGEIKREEQTQFGPDDHPRTNVPTDLLDRLVREGLVTVEEEMHPTVEGDRRRIYRVNRNKQKG